MKLVSQFLIFASYWKIIAFVFLVCFVAVSGVAMAACSNPAGKAGGIIFSEAAKAMQYCNGTDWINAGAVIIDAPQTGCTGPTGKAGGVIYNHTQGVVQFCNGSQWVDTACAAQRKPNGSGCDDAGKPGQMRYVGGTVNELQFCDSTNWVAMGWGCPNDLSAPVWNSPTTSSYTAMEGLPFGFVPNVTDDKGITAYSQQGTLPPGITFDPATGGVSGNPSVLGTYSFTIRATDASANSVERTFTVEVVPAEVVVHIAANATNVNLQTLFGGADWADSAKGKRVIIDTGVTVGLSAVVTPALRTGTGRGGSLIIENHGTVAGAGGAANGGAGGNALLVEQAGVSVVNSGTLAGGGGGGGRGGNGGSGSYNTTVREPASGEYYTYPTYMLVSGSWVTQIYWGGTKIYDGGTYTGPIYIGGYYYYMGSKRDSTAYGFYRTYTAFGGYTSGGAGGNGGRGQGSDGAATAGLAGAAGGTNAGTGGKGGNGGAYGVAGSAGATGASGNVSAGLAGSAGGAAGAAITGSGYTLTNTGTVLGSH